VAPTPIPEYRRALPTLSGAQLALVPDPLPDTSAWSIGILLEQPGDVIIKTVERAALLRDGPAESPARAYSSVKGVLVMEQAAYCLFETPLGACGIAWKERENSRIPPAVTFFQLPEATRTLTDARIAGSSGGRMARVPPPRIAGIIGKVRKHLRGELQDFLDVAVDLDGAGPFARQVYEAVRKIPAGRTTTYGGLAAGMNRPTAARAVGQALGRNPVPLIIPCHRVLARGKNPGGFSAHGGVETKAKLLDIEGATLRASR